MEQAQVQQLQLQGAVDSLKGVIDLLLQDKMNLSAQNYILATQLKEALQEVEKIKEEIQKIKTQEEIKKDVNGETTSPS